MRVRVSVDKSVDGRERERRGGRGREGLQFQYPRLLDGGNQFGVGTVVRPYIIRQYVRLLCSGVEDERD